MTITETASKLPIFEMLTDADGLPMQGELIKVEDIVVVDIYAETDKTFRRISDKSVVGDHITIGTSDRVENYEEVDA